MPHLDWPALWTNLLHFGTPDSVTHPVSLLEKVVRPVVVYLVLVFGLKTVGKRLLAQLNPFDLVVLLMLSNTVQNAIIGNDTSLAGGIVGAAALMGINVHRVYLLTFGASASLAMVAGALLTPVYTATPSIGFQFVLPAFAVVVLGGLGSVPGSLIGGLLVGVVEQLSGFYLDPALKQAVWFTLFIIALVFRPAGLFGQVGSEHVGAR